MASVIGGARVNKGIGSALRLRSAGKARVRPSLSARRMGAPNLYPRVIRALPVLDPRSIRTRFARLRGAPVGRDRATGTGTGPDGGQG
ncbi:hypothetical protein ACX84U_29160, partial [Burkholderia pseudomallei]